MPRVQENAPPEDPALCICLGPSGGPRGGGGRFLMSEVPKREARAQVPVLGARLEPRAEGGRI